MPSEEDTWKPKRADFLYPELSYIINGALFDVFKEIGGGHLEKYYQKAVAKALEIRNLKFHEQFSVPLTYAGQHITKYLLDFLVEESIVLELKRGLFIPANVIRQTKQYLIAANLRLGIIACFTHHGVIIKRVLNIY